jgi:anti-sigma regulatory factor (Ser/Thr protein kinase)
MDTLATPTPFDVTPNRVGWDASTLDLHRPVAGARHRARVWLQEHWKLSELADPVELAVGELCANAVRHGEGLVGLELVLRAGRRFAPPLLRVMVLDHAPDRVPELPTLVDPFSEGGRGLRLVEALSCRWGWHRTGFDEKQVWCTFALALS